MPRIQISRRTSQPAQARRLLEGGLTVALLIGATAAAAPSAAATVPRGLTAGVVSAPAPLPATDRRRHLAYELLVQNASTHAVRLQRLSVRDLARSKELAAYRGTRLAQLLVRGDGQQGTPALPAGMGTVILLDIRLRPGQAVPGRLGHRLRVTHGDGERATLSASIRVSRRAPARLSPPLRQDAIFGLGCCGRPFTHRLSALERDGRPVFAQRYALDLVQLQGDATSAGDPAVNASYFVYGDEVVAAADGRIAATRDGMPDNTPPGLPPGIGIDDAAGNFVNQDLGNGRFALYAHFQPGSLRVKPGDQVRRGQVLGLVGNSGNSSEPHLHFHVMDAQGGASNLEADGLPFVFDSFRLQARVTGLDQDPPAPVRVPVSETRPRTNQYPLTGNVVGFAPTAR